jgi:ORF6N domain
MAERILVPAERIEHAILVLRGQKVMLDSELAALYEVPVKALNQAVKRNLDRFPEDFMFQLSQEEAASLRSQSVTSKAGRGGRRNEPYAFTEQGVAMLSSVLRMAAFDVATAPMFCQIDTNRAQSRTLATLRDTLLPKLLSGELRVRN